MKMSKLSVCVLIISYIFGISGHGDPKEPEQDIRPLAPIFAVPLLPNPVPAPQLPVQNN